MIVAISPHLDDAILSIGQHLAGSPGARVITVLAGLPPERVTVTAHDALCGFTSSREAVTVRRFEDARACEVVGAEPEHLDYLDGQYRAFELELSASFLVGLPDDAELFIPLGLGHPDHVDVAGGITRALGRLYHRRWFAYADMPYRSLYPGAEEARVAELERAGWTVNRSFGHHQGSRTTKQAAIACYRSQRNAIAMPCPLLPEHVFEVTR